MDWLKWGDNNTKFFHTATLVRRRRNRVETLLNDNEDWVKDNMELKNLVLSSTRVYLLLTLSLEGSSSEASSLKRRSTPEDI